MAGVPRPSRDFHLSIATRGLAPKTFEAGPVSVRGFYLLGSRHTAGGLGRGTKSGRANVTVQEMTVRTTYLHKIWDASLLVTTGDEDLLKVSSQFVRTVEPEEIIINIQYMGASRVDK